MCRCYLEEELSGSSKLNKQSSSTLLKQVWLRPSLGKEYSIKERRVFPFINLLDSDK